MTNGIGLRHGKQDDGQGILSGVKALTRQKLPKRVQTFDAATGTGSLEAARGTEQVSLFLGPNFVVTFLEDPGDCFDCVRQWLRGAKGPFVPIINVASLSSGLQKKKKKKQRL